MRNILVRLYGAPHILLGLLEWAVEELCAAGHRVLCAVGSHYWSFTYARSYDDPHLRSQCVRCDRERIVG